MAHLFSRWTDLRTRERHLHRQMTLPAILKADRCWHQQPWYGEIIESLDWKLHHIHNYQTPSCQCSGLSSITLWLRNLDHQNKWPEETESLFEMRLYRKILYISWKGKIRNDVLTRISSCKFKSKRMLDRITESQLTWFGHVCRMNNMRHSKHILMDTIPGTKTYGRPRKRWEDDIMAACTDFHLATSLIGMLRIEMYGLNLFVEPTSCGTRCRDR